MEELAPAGILPRAQKLLPGMPAFSAYHPGGVQSSFPSATLRPTIFFAVRVSTILVPSTVRTTGEA